MAEDERLYMVCDDSDSLPQSKEDVEKTRKLDSDPIIQARIRKDMEEAKRIFGL